MVSHPFPFTLFALCPCLCSWLLCTFALLRVSISLRSPTVPAVPLSPHHRLPSPGPFPATIRKEAKARTVANFPALRFQTSPHFICTVICTVICRTVYPEQSQRYVVTQSPPSWQRYSVGSRWWRWASSQDRKATDSKAKDARRTCNRRGTVCSLCVVGAPGYPAGQIAASVRSEFRSRSSVEVAVVGAGHSRHSRRCQSQSLVQVTVVGAGHSRRCRPSVGYVRRGARPWHAV